MYKGKDLSCDVASLSVGVSYKFRVAAKNAMGMGLWGDEKLYTSRAVAPEVRILFIARGNGDLRCGPYYTVTSDVVRNRSKCVS